jgi:hypothetical protein
MLRLHRPKQFGQAPSHPLDGNAKARLWAAAQAYNHANRQKGQHWGPLTRTTMDVLKTLLWRFHGADGGGRCFPAYEKIARMAKCCRDSVAVAITALEEAGLLTWVHRLAKVRRDDEGALSGSAWRVVRTSNGYTFTDPLERIRGTTPCTSENPPRPLNRSLKEDGARYSARVLAPPWPPPEKTEPKIAADSSTVFSAGAKLGPFERAALVARMDAGTATREDWIRYSNDLDARIAAC